MWHRRGKAFARGIGWLFLGSEDRTDKGVRFIALQSLVRDSVCPSVKRVARAADRNGVCGYCPRPTAGSKAEPWFEPRWVHDGISTTDARRVGPRQWLEK